MRPATYWRNQELLADRLGWPAGALETCRRLEDEHDGWMVSWIGENGITGWERPAGWVASRNDCWLVGGDELRRSPEDGVGRRPQVFATDPDELVKRMAAMMERIAEKQEREGNLWRAMSSGT